MEGEGRIAHRYAELRHDGRTVEGVAVRYGDEARIDGGRETIARGAFNPVGDVVLNVMHKRHKPIARTGGNLRIDDDGDELKVRAELPNTRDADDALELIRANVLRGLSVEMRVLDESIEGDLRIVKRARLVGIGIVDKPAYTESTVAARRGLQQSPTLAGRAVDYWQ